MKYRCVSDHIEDLADGRMVGPGEVVELEEDSLREDHNERLFAEGKLVAIDDTGEEEAKLAARRGRRDAQEPQEGGDSQ